MEHCPGCRTRFLVEAGYKIEDCHGCGHEVELAAKDAKIADLEAECDRLASLRCLRHQVNPVAPEECVACVVEERDRLRGKVEEYWRR